MNKLINNIHWLHTSTAPDRYDRHFYYLNSQLINKIELERWLNNKAVNN